MSKLPRASVTGAQLIPSLLPSISTLPPVPKVPTTCTVRSLAPAKAPREPSSVSAIADQVARNAPPSISLLSTVTVAMSSLLAEENFRGIRPRDTCREVHVRDLQAHRGVSAIFHLFLARAPHRHHRAQIHPCSDGGRGLYNELFLTLLIAA